MASSSSYRKRKQASRTKPSAGKYSQDAVKYVLDGDEPPYLFTVGEKLRLLKGPDADRCRQIQQLLRDYISGKESKPISIVVFGPPGSGKSFYVRELFKSLWNHTPKKKEKKTSAAKLGKFTEINLAQLYTPLDLSERLNFSVRMQ